MYLDDPIKKYPIYGVINVRGDYKTMFSFRDLCLKLFILNDQNFHSHFWGNNLIFKDNIFSFPTNVCDHDA